MAIIGTDPYHVSNLPFSGALLGLDLGTKTIGLAVCDPARRVATPLETLKRRKFLVDLEAIKHTAAERQVVGLVVGLPLNMDGTEGPRAQSARSFVRNAEKQSDLAFAFWDERLSTEAMDREMIALDTSRRKRAALIDQMAAAYILQGAIDAIRQVS